METSGIQDVDQAHHMYHFSYQQLCSARLALDTIGTDHQSPGSSFGTVALLREPRLVPMQTAPSSSDRSDEVSAALEYQRGQL